MFSLFKKQSSGTKQVLSIQGMHCVSCAMNIDGALEETPGVISATTNFAKAKLTLEYDPEQISLEDIQRVVAKQGYTVTA